MTQGTEMQTLTIASAYLQGLERGKRVTIGEQFAGAGAEAEARGMVDEQRRAFVQGYLDGLPQVWTDEAGHVVRLEAKGRHS